MIFFSPKPWTFTEQCRRYQKVHHFIPLPPDFEHKPSQTAGRSFPLKDPRGNWLTTLVFGFVILSIYLMCFAVPLALRTATAASDSGLALLGW